MSRESFLNDLTSPSIFFGGSGKGGTYTGLLKFKHFASESNLLVYCIKNPKDLNTSGGAFRTALEIFEQDIKYYNEVLKVIEFKSGARLLFISVDQLKHYKPRALFVDNATQLDEFYSIDYFTSKAESVWFNTVSNKCRGFCFNLIEPYLVDKGGYYKPINVGVNGVHYGTCEGNKEFLSSYPSYIEALKAQPIKTKNKLLYGYFYK